MSRSGFPRHYSYINCIGFITGTRRYSVKYKVFFQQYYPSKELHWSVNFVVGHADIALNLSIWSYDFVYRKVTNKPGDMCSASSLAGDLAQEKAHENGNPHRVYKIVLTGGPCGGKTTGQSRLSTFFENLGWKVFRVPEAATVLLSGGIKFSDLSHDETIQFQENLLKTILQIENTFFSLGECPSFTF